MLGKPSEFTNKTTLIHYSRFDTVSSPYSKHDGSITTYQRAGSSFGDDNRGIMAHRSFQIEKGGE